ncbi:Potassium channel tetramerization-type BTB domain [Trypanosoma melophagium]|uniref:Potassium channel tetramerization-type BTB domain n=1 Tax=Trypanosoma melophagium TaxID=715481 RepID=UPI00351A677B|nr:Potassium channel tetramerization-type BTB domain [Trypanosoma melophagium]
MTQGAPSKKYKRRRSAERSERVDETEKQIDTRQDVHASQALSHSSVDRRVCINVGGSSITTLESTLRSEPSLLSEWLNNDFAGLPRDAMGNPFVDRDPENFRHILNYLRGYGLPLATEQIVFLAEDAEFYRIEKLRALIDPPAQWRFVSGPGVSPDNTLFSTDNILGTCGNEPLPIKGKSILTLRVDKCELVSVGLLGTESPAENEPLQNQSHAITYCNTGELVRCFNGEQIYTSGTGFKTRDLIEVEVHFTPTASAKVVFYCGTLKMHETEWPEPVPPLHFAVSLHGTSAVIIEKCITIDSCEEETSPAEDSFSP